MLSSPQSVTLNSVADDLDRVTSKETSSVYQNAEGTVKLTVSHQQTKNRTRRMCRLDKTVIAEDPLTAENAYQSAGVYLVIDEPVYGFTDAELDDLVDGLTTWLTSANIAAMLANRH